MSDDESYDLAAEFAGMTKEEAGFALLPDDTYTWRVVHAEDGKSPSKQTPYVKCRLEIVDGKFAGHSEWLTVYWSSTQGGRDMFARRMIKMGIDWDQVLELRTLRNIATATVGAIFTGRSKQVSDDFGDKVEINPTKLISPGQGSQDSSAAAASPGADSLDAFKGLLDDEEPSSPPPADEKVKPVGDPTGAVDLSTVTLDDEPAKAPKQPAKVPAATETGDEDPWS